MDPSDQVGSLVTSEKENEIFQAKVLGTYKIEVKVNGQRLVKSPFAILVKARGLNVVGKLDFQGQMLRGPAGIAVNNKGVFAVADNEGHCILLFDETGKFVRKIGCQDNKGGQFESPIDVTVLNGDEILLADECNHPIQQLNVQTGNFVKSFGEQGIGDGELKNPVSVCKFGEKGNGGGQLHHLSNFCVDKHGNLFVCERGNGCIQQLTL